VDTTQVLQDLHGRVRPIVDDVVADLTPAQLVWAPASGANTIGWLVWHLIRVLDHHLADLLGDSQLLPTFADRFGRVPDPDDTGYGDSPEEVMSVRPESSDALAEYHAAVQQRLTSFLANLTDEDLDRVVDDAWDPPVTVGVRLVSMAVDALQHAGQAAYVRGLLPR
jgi:uncharacterized damage-inducible protein DinB